MRLGPGVGCRRTAQSSMSTTLGNVPEHFTRFTEMITNGHLLDQGSVLLLSNSHEFPTDCLHCASTRRGFALIKRRILP